MTIDFAKFLHDNELWVKTTLSNGQVCEKCVGYNYEAQQFLKSPAGKRFVNDELRKDRSREYLRLILRNTLAKANEQIRYNKSLATTWQGRFLIGLTEINRRLKFYYAIAHEANRYLQASGAWFDKAIEYFYVNDETFQRTREHCKDKPNRDALADKLHKSFRFGSYEPFESVKYTHKHKVWDKISGTYDDVGNETIEMSSADWFNLKEFFKICRKICGKKMLRQIGEKVEKVSEKDYNPNNWFEATHWRPDDMADARLA